MDEKQDELRLVVFFEAKKGYSEQLENILISSVEPIRRKHGNKEYILHKSTESSEEFMLDEIWKNEESLREHLEEQYIKNLWTKVQPLLSKPIEIKKYKYNDFAIS